MKHRIEILSVGGGVLERSCWSNVGAEQREALETFQDLFSDLNDIIDEVAPHVSKVLECLLGNFRGRIQTKCVGGNYHLRTVNMKIDLQIYFLSVKKYFLRMCPKIVLPDCVWLSLCLLP